MAMIHLLDTNAWISYIKSSASPVRSRLEQLPPNGIATCSIVKAELLYGIYNSSRRDANLALFLNLFKEVLSYPFDDAAADVYGRIRAELTRAGTPIGPNDLMIAAIALCHDLVLITHNLSEFSRVPGLRLEDWQV
jgi:tRNA(fMet)-specific endonuclease VapC